VKILWKGMAAASVTALVALGVTGVAGAAEAEGTYGPVVCTGNQVLVDGTCVDPPAEVSEADVSAGSVEEATAVQSVGALPYTGSDSLPLAELGVALLAAGGLMTVAVRRRHTAERS
jgi:LPXTG-motif cell wall-anchored protein